MNTPQAQRNLGYVASQIVAQIGSAATATATDSGDGRITFSDKSAGNYDTFTVAASKLGGPINVLFDIIMVTP